ncbi:hypothetical protein M3194_26450 [Paenibacillus glycanilyticus]|uniref:hypothetical protein n=1 Tax=Paenibacillus glycanilyticus TaxID=126569 RepID=UPI00203D3362|nr:hypothetical protein [Paenibacillus glycanilyticus]MCM3630882.1 hypothetical protein [Paenibacillus glycanilyticus]
MKPTAPVTRDHISQSEGVSPLFQRLHWHTALEINYIPGQRLSTVHGMTFSRGISF